VTFHFYYKRNLISFGIEADVHPPHQSDQDDTSSQRRRNDSSHE